MSDDTELYIPEGYEPSIESREREPVWLRRFVYWLFGEPELEFVNESDE
jgi:hypothetical protein